MGDKKKQIVDSRWQIADDRTSISNLQSPICRYLVSRISYLKKGYTLVEIMIAMVVLVLGLIPLVKLIGDSLIATTDLGSRTVASELTQDLMEEIKQRKWDEGAGADGLTAAGARTIIGLNGGGETLANKTTLNDIDDYNGLSENPPRNASNTQLPQYGKYTRSVEVRYIQFNAGPNTFTLAPNDGMGTNPLPALDRTDYKRIQVTVRWTSGGGKNREVVHQTIMSNMVRR